MEEILKPVRRARRRLVASSALGVGVEALFWTGLASAGLLLLKRWIRPWPIPVWGALAAAVPVGAWIWAILRRPSLRSAALRLDRSAGLGERLSAALWVNPEGAPAERAVVRDALQALGALGDRQVPLARPRAAKLLIPAVLVAVALALPRSSPNPTGAGAGGPAALSALVPEPVRKEQSERLRRRAFSLEKKARELEKPELREIAEAMRKTAEEMRKEEITRNEALAKISSLEEKTRDRKAELASKMPDSLTNRLKAAAAGSQGGDRKAEMAKKLSEMAKTLEGLKEKLGAGGDPAARQSEIQRALDRLRESLGSVPGKELPGTLGERLEELLGKEGAPDPAELEGLLGELRKSQDDLALLQALEGELDSLLALKDDLSDLDGMCLLCGKLKHGLKGGT